MMLVENVIEPGQSNWVAQLVFIPKKDDTLQFCVNFRKINAVTKRDSYSISRMEECIDSLADVTRFLMLHANSGYWQVEIDEKEKDKIAFTSHYALYRFVRIPYGLRNEPSTFQHIMDIIQSSVEWKFSLVYLGDIVVFKKPPLRHRDHVRKVIFLLQSIGTTLKLKMQKFLADTIDYLSHMIRPRCSKLPTHTTDAIHGLQTPIKPSETTRRSPIPAQELNTRQQTFIAIRHKRQRYEST